MHRNKTYNRKKILIISTVVLMIVVALTARLVYLMVFRSDYYGEMAQELHERERDIKAARGKIIDSTGTVLATNRTVCTISVIYSQVKDREAVIHMLCEELSLSEETVRKRVEKRSSIERVKSNVDKETGDRIRTHGMAGVKVDEDYKRYYPFDSLASKVLGFTGGDNQGIIGLEVMYEKYLKGEAGKILTLTDARGVEIKNAGERRLEPVDGYNLHVSLDYNIQIFVEQTAAKVKEAKSANSVSILLMNPQNGEVMAMASVPEFNLNDPFTLNTSSESEAPEPLTPAQKQDLLNRMWRNPCINDTYEPGSTFKVITSAAALEEQVVKLSDRFFCPGYKIVEDRKIRCHKVGGHGPVDFTEGIMGSCNPVFIELGMRLGVDKFYEYFKQFGLMEKTGIDLPGEAGTIMHNKKNVGQVELATVSFGQSFQITPIQLATTVSSLVNGGTRITPHFGVVVKDNQGNLVEELQYKAKAEIVRKDTSETMAALLEKVVSEGTGKKAFIPGFSIGGKTATSQTLPRSAHRYIASFVGFAPADNPQVLALVIIDNPQGIYYGGTIAAPVVGELFANVLPYLGIERTAVVESTE